MLETALSVSPRAVHHPALRTLHVLTIFMERGDLDVDRVPDFTVGMVSGATGQMWIFVNTVFVPETASAKTRKNLRVIFVYHVHRVSMEMDKNVQIDVEYIVLMAAHVLVAIDVFASRVMRETRVREKYAQ